MGDFKLHLAKIFDYVPSAIQCLAHDTNSHSLAVGKADGSIEIWKTDTRWYQQKIIPGSDKRTVNSVVWINGRLFSSGLQGDITEYDLMKNFPKISHFYGHGFWCMAASHSKTHLALGCEDGCVRIFKIMEKGVAFEKALDFQKERIVSLAWHHSDETMVTGSADSIRLWQVSSGHASQRITLQRAHKRQEVVVWCVTILKNYTVVSGDSDGKTNFWNGRNGTLLHSFSSHRGPVLSMCVSRDEENVCTAGVDARLVQFALVSINEEGSIMEWVQSNVTRDHTHDVKALTIADKFIVSGGVDTFVIAIPLMADINAVVPWKNKKMISVIKKRLYPFPLKPLVHCTTKSNLLLCQHQAYLELWRLGATTAQLEKAEDGDRLPVEVPPCKLIQLKSKSGEQIICSAISPCGLWLAYSDGEKVRLYSVGSNPVALNKVLVLPTNLYPSHQLEFTPDSSKIVSASNQRTIQVLSVEDISPKLLHTFSPMEQSISCFTLEPNGSACVAADIEGRMKIFKLRPNYEELPTTLPHYKPITCMDISSRGMLFVVYMDRAFAEFDIKNQTYTKWFKEKCERRMHHSWLNTQTNIMRAQYNPFNPEQVLLQETMNFTIISKDKPFPKDTDMLFEKTHLGKRPHEGSKPEIKHGFSICQKFKPLLYAGFLSEKGSLIVIERSLEAIQEQLPPPLHRKKFGT